MPQETITLPAVYACTWQSNVLFTIFSKTTDYIRSASVGQYYRGGWDFNISRLPSDLTIEDVSLSVTRTAIVGVPSPMTFTWTTTTAENQNSNAAFWAVAFFAPNKFFDMPTSEGTNSTDITAYGLNKIRNYYNAGNEIITFVMEIPAAGTSIDYSSILTNNELTLTYTYSAISEPYEKRYAFRDVCIWKGYVEDMNYTTMLPTHWEGSSFTAQPETEIRATEPGELIYQNELLISDYALAVDVITKEGLILELRTRRNESSAGETYIALEIDVDNGRYRFKENEDGTLYTHEWIDHDFDADTYYRFELWTFGSVAWAFFNGCNMTSRLLLSNNTEPNNFSIYVNNFDGDYLTFKRFAVRELVEAPEPLFDDSDLIVQFRKEMTASIEDVQHENWTAFKAAHKLHRLKKNYARANSFWWEDGYPVREPSTEKWLKP